VYKVLWLYQNDADKGYLTHEESIELEQLMVEAQTDYEYLIESQK
jgi:hypothetical protein